MPVIAVVNRKGGSGKSTLATHLAAWCANAGIPVMLGDVDRQQSTQTWLRLREARRPAQRAPLVGWAVDPKRVLRPPAGIHHIVLDTPGGLRGFDLARVAMCADVILLPVCNSVFDRESSAECQAELMTLPRVASGRCKVAAVGMRLDGRTRAAEQLQAWAARLDLPFIGVLRETQAYVRCIEDGLTLFDLPPSQVQADMAQWQPILDWLEPVLRQAPAPEGPLATAAPRPTFPCHTGSPGAAPLRKASLPDSPSVSTALTAPSASSASNAANAANAPNARNVPNVPPTPGESTASSTPPTPALTLSTLRTDSPRPLRDSGLRPAGLFGWLPIPRFLQRDA